MIFKGISFFNEIESKNSDGLFQYQVRAGIGATITDTLTIDKALDIDLTTLTFTNSQLKLDIYLKLENANLISDISMLIAENISLQNTGSENYKMYFFNDKANINIFSKNINSNAQILDINDLTNISNNENQQLLINRAIEISSNNSIHLETQSNTNFLRLQILLTGKNGAGTGSLRINKLRFFKDLGRLSSSDIAMPKLSFSQNESVYKTISNKSIIIKENRTTEITLDIPTIYKQSDYDLLLNIHKTQSPFFIYCSGGISNERFLIDSEGFRIQDIYKVLSVGNQQETFINNIYSQFKKFSLSLAEVE